MSTIEKEDDNGVDLHDEDIDFLPEIFDDRLPPRNHVPALLGWLSALLVLLLLSILWLFCSRRFRLHVRRRRFASGCSSLSCIERQYLDDNHHEVLLEQSGSIRCSNGNGSGGFQSSNILMEMGVLKQPKAIQAASCQDRTVATEDSSETPR